ncbi:MAG: hypothetical protein ABIA78_02125 [archaeon]
MLRKKQIKKRGRKTKRVVRSTRRKINLVFRNLILFALMSSILFLLYSVSGNESLREVFCFSSVFGGFVTLAFFIALLGLIFLRMMKK